MSLTPLTLRLVKNDPLTNAEVDGNFTSLDEHKLEINGSNSMTAKLVTVASGTGQASLRLTEGTANPTSSDSGDIWNNQGVIKYYDGSDIYTFANLEGEQTLFDKTLDEPRIIGAGIVFEGDTEDDFETTLAVVDPTADRTLTLPNATDTIVAQNTPDTLQNKSLVDSTTYIIDNLDTTKRLQLQVNTITSGQTRTLTVPDYDGTVVTIDGTETLTNKTLTTPKIAEIDSLTGGDILLDSEADIILDADGADIILRDAGTEFGRLRNSSGQLAIGSSTNQTAITLNNTDAAIEGDLTVKGNDIKSSTNATAITLAGADVTVAGDLQVTGNDIKSSTAATAITLVGADVTVAGDLQVTGNDIKSSTGAVAINLSGANVTIAGNLTVSGTTTTVNSSTLDVADKNITVAKGNTTDANADGAGITVEATTSTNKTFQYDNTNTSWTSSEHLNIASGKVYKVGGTQIAASNLSNGTTGSGQVVLATTPTLITPVLGTPTSGTLTNCTGLPNGGLLNSSVTVSAGTGMSGGGSVALGSSITLTNAGVTSNVAGTGISLNAGTGAVTITNSGVTSAVAGTGVGVSGATGAVTFSIGQAVATSSNVQFNSLGVGTAGSAVTGEIRATNEITAYYTSDARLKENVVTIEGAIEKVCAIRGVTFDWTQQHVEARGGEDGYFVRKHDVGVIAQEVEMVLPEVVAQREDGFKAVRYEKMVPLLIEAVKQLKAELDEVKKNCACNK